MRKNPSVISIIRQYNEFFASPANMKVFKSKIYDTRFELDNYLFFFIRSTYVLSNGNSKNVFRIWVLNKGDGRTHPYDLNEYSRLDEMRLVFSGERQIGNFDSYVKRQREKNQ